MLDAGHLGERLYLAAEARALAACSVGAFYDDEMAGLLGEDPAGFWVLHLVALGARA
jgi:nitroreductase